MKDDDKGQHEVRVLKRTVIPVSAKHCLWFAWADPALSGPEREDETSRPQADGFVQGASQVQINVTDPAAQWGHHPTPDRMSGPDGLDGTGGIPNDERGLENPAYKSATYHSEGIQELTTHLNKLLAMFDLDGSPPTPSNPAEQIPVGSGATLNVPAGATQNTRLFLGFHDGREWSNNDGTMEVEVSWIVSDGSTQ